MTTPAPLTLSLSVNERGQLTIDKTLFGLTEGEYILGMGPVGTFKGGTFGAFDASSYIIKAGSINGSVLNKLYAEVFDNGKSVMKYIDFTIKEIDTVANSGNNYLIGNNSANKIDGLGGNDIIKGLGGNDTLIGGSGNDIIAGGSGNDKVYGEDGNDNMSGGTGNDYLSGGAGADVLNGGTGMDIFVGGTGADRFVFNTAADSTVAAAGRDTILDFKITEGDKIDLRGIDANVSLSGNQAFHFEGTSAKGGAGALWFSKQASDTYIYGDTNGDGKADFAIHSDDALNVTKDYFLL